ncbi:hypothetical protein [Oleiharenicola sp. Vm1]|uniref:hypothetical protein n=1 Tax=Oleiharenicola sp. Vm1 TaxID=3398393 RepID=UPI0039F6127D
MKKKQMKVQVDDAVEAKLHSSAGRYGLTGNSILAAAAYELARVRPENLFHALGRIAQGEGVELMPPDTEAIPAPRKPQRRALPATT